jgi:hypothetical protein
MNGSHQHGLTSLSSVIVYDFNIARPGLAIRPLETNAPLLVDANGILSSAISFERFEPASWQSAQRSGALLWEQIAVPLATSVCRFCR